MPVVGDWDGDGIDDIGVYRNGTWILDMNHNRTIDAADKVFEMGDVTDRELMREGMSGSDVVYHIAGVYDFSPDGIARSEYRKACLSAVASSPHHSRTTSRRVNVPSMFVRLQASSAAFSSSGIRWATSCSP